MGKRKGARGRMGVWGQGGGGAWEGIKHLIDSMGLV
jgi:hypothetical protein